MKYAPHYKRLKPCVIIEILLDLQHIIGLSRFTTARRVAQRGKYHVYGYKYLYTITPRTNLKSTFSLVLYQHGL